MESGSSYRVCDGELIPHGAGVVEDGRVLLALLHYDVIVLRPPKQHSGGLVLPFGHTHSVCRRQTL